MRDGSLGCGCALLILVANIIFWAAMVWMVVTVAKVAWG